MNGACKSSHDNDDGKCALSSVDSLKTSYKRNKSNVNFMHGALMSSVTRWGEEKKNEPFSTVGRKECTFVAKEFPHDGVLYIFGGA